MLDFFEIWFAFTLPYLLYRIIEGRKNRYNTQENLEKFVEETNKQVNKWKQDYVELISMYGDVDNFRECITQEIIKDNINVKATVSIYASIKDTLTSMLPSVRNIEDDSIRGKLLSDIILLIESSDDNIKYLIGESDE